MTPEAAARWARERERGRTHFVWRRGVMGWGIPAALLTLAYRAWQLHAAGTALSLDAPDLRHAIGVAVVLIPVCGYLFGAWLWEREEGEYRRHRGTRD